MALGPAARNARPAPDGLRGHAAARGLIYGAAVSAADIGGAGGLPGALATECGMLVPGNELKWSRLRPAPDTFDFGPADAIHAFADANGMLFRGHTLLWWKQLPAWFAGTATAGNAAGLLETHINTVVAHFKGRAQSWDVVNEGLDPKSDRSDGLAPSAWLDLLGPGYIATAFRLAHAADPSALLVYNENNMDDDSGYSDRKRAQVLSLLTSLRDEGVPVGALGIQAHLSATETTINPEKLRGFIGAVADLGLKVIISELDVRDDRVPGAPADRDVAVARIYAAYLDAVLAEPNVIAVVTWGLSDKWSWLNRYWHRKDGLPLRPLPLDADLTRKPAWRAMMGAFDAAPNRPGPG